MKTKIMKVICLMPLLISFIYCFYLKYQNIGKPEMWLFKTYWLRYLIIVIVCMVTSLNYQHLFSNKKN